MPRNYVKKTDRGTARGTLERAKFQVQKGMSVRSAAVKFNINRSTLARYIKSDGVSSFGYDHLSETKRIFNEQQESDFAKHIVELSNIFHGISRTQCQVFACEFAMKNNLNIPASWSRNGKAGEDWFIGFKRRQKLSLRSPEATSLARATAFNFHTVGIFFNNLYELMSEHKFNPQDIFNVDETGLRTVQAPTRVVTKLGVRQVGAVTSAERGELVTLICTVNAVGNALPPVFIFPRARVKDSVLNGAPAGSIASKSRSGWVNESIFCQEYLPHLISLTRCSKENQILLIMDNHSSHICLETIDKAKQNGIHILTIPPHTSHKLQPLDVSVFGPLKSAYNSAMDDWMKSHVGRTVDIYTIPEILNTAFKVACTPSNITSGFKAAGIYPLDRNRFQDSDFAPASVSDRPPPCQTGDLCEEINNDQPSTSWLSNTPTLVSAAAASSYVSPREIRPMPKCGPRTDKRARKKKKSEILTKTPTRNKIEQETRNRQVNTKKQKSGKVSVKKSQPVRRRIIESDSENERRNVEHEDQEIAQGDWVMVRYDGAEYPGEVTEVRRNEIRVNVMEKSGKNWKWPCRRDDIFYDKTEVVTRLHPPVVVGSRGQFSFDM